MNTDGFWFFVFCLFAWLGIPRISAWNARYYGIPAERTARLARWIIPIAVIFGCLVLFRII